MRYYTTTLHVKINLKNDILYIIINSILNQKRL